MNILFAHSDDLAVALLTKWLFWSDIIKLDTACASSKSSRNNLRRLFACKEAVFPNSALLGEMRLAIMFCNRIHSELFKWLLLRKVKVTDVELTSELIANSTLMEEYFVLCGSGLQMLTVVDHDHKLVSVVLKHCSGLKGLIMHNWEQGVQSCTYFSEHVETFFMSTPSNEYRRIPDDFVINFPKLKQLIVSGSDLPEPVLLNLIGNSTRLQRIKLKESHDYARLNVIKPIWHNLQHLTLDYATVSSAELGVLLRQMPQLTELVLSIVFDTDEQENLTPQDAFQAVSESCPALTMFHYIYGGEGEAQDKNVAAFTTVLNNCPHLRDICIGDKFVTNAFLHAIASHPIAPNISHLTVTSCDINRVGLAAIARKCTGLQYISYSFGSYYRTSELCRHLFQKGVKVHVHIDNYCSD